MGKATDAIALINIAGGIAAFLVATATATPGVPDGTQVAYVFGLFQVNVQHGLMHVLIGIVGLAWRATGQAAPLYLAAHTAWFTLLAVVGFVGFAEPAPHRRLMGMSINLADHIGHVILAGLSLLAMTPLVTSGAPLGYPSRR